MQRNNMWRIGFVVLLVVLAGYYIYPTYRYLTLPPEQAEQAKKSRAGFQKLLPSWSSASHIVPGLDLHGAAMRVSIAVDEAQRDRADRHAHAAERRRAEQA